MATHFPNFAEMADFEYIETWSTDGRSLGSLGLAWVGGIIAGGDRELAISGGDDWLIGDGDDVRILRGSGDIILFFFTLLLVYLGV